MNAPKILFSVNYRALAKKSKTLVETITLKSPVSHQMLAHFSQLTRQYVPITNQDQFALILRRKHVIPILLVLSKKHPLKPARKQWIVRLKLKMTAPISTVTSVLG